MFELHDVVVNLIKVESRTGERDKDNENEPDIMISFSMTASNDYLNGMSAGLKNSTYKKDDGPDANEIFEGSENFLPKLKHPEMENKFRVKKDGSIVGAHVALDYGIGEPIVLDNATAYGATAQAQEGGTCFYTWRVKAQSTEERTGAIMHNLVGGQVNLTITKPTSPQATLIEE